MTNKPVRPRVDELMIGGNRDVDRKEAAEVDDRIPPQDHTADEKCHTNWDGPRRKYGVRPEPLRPNAEPNAHGNDNPENPERIGVFRNGLFARSSCERQNQ